MQDGDLSKKPDTELRFWRIKNKAYNSGVLEKVKELERKTWWASEGRAEQRNLVRNKRLDRKLGTKAGFETQSKLFNLRDRRPQDSQTESSQLVPTQGRWIRAQSQRQAGQDLPGQERAEPRGSSTSCTSAELLWPALPNTRAQILLMCSNPHRPNPRANWKCCRANPATLHLISIQLRHASCTLTFKTDDSERAHERDGYLIHPKSFPDHCQAACSGAEHTGTVIHTVLWDRATGKHCIKHKWNRMGMKTAKCTSPNQNTVKIDVLTNHW